MTEVIQIFLILFPLMVHGYTEGSINLLVRSSVQSNVQRYCIELAQLPNNSTVDIATFGWRTPYFASSSVNACNISNLNDSIPNSLSSNTILVLYEHECKITEHAWNVEILFQSKISLMIITNRTNTYYELTYNTTAMPVTIPVLVFWANDFLKLNTKYPDLNSVEFSIDYPPDLSTKFRPAILIMFLLVFIILICGNFWAADEFKNRIKTVDLDTISLSSKSTAPSTTNERSFTEIATRRNSIPPSKAPQNAEPAVIPMTYCIIVLIICFAVGWLLLLYYFPTVMIYILQVMFCIGAFTSLMSCFNRLSYFVPILRRYRTSYHRFRKPCIFKLGPLNLFTVFAICVSLTLVIIWYVYRRSDWAWILQNILGAAVCMTVLSIYRLGNMRVITVILVAFFLYDIFFVFITPYIPIFQHSSNSNSTMGSSSSNTQVSSRQPSKNPSVMEQVALGIGTNGEVVPLLFSLPLLIPQSEMDPCLSERKSMLGFGDVILPGILLTFCKIFDIASANRWPVYYIQSVISYFVGLSATHIALHLMRTAQPALLYIVPCLLISTIVTSLLRRELKELYTGQRIVALLYESDATEDTPVEQVKSDIVIGISEPSGVDNH